MKVMLSAVGSPVAPSIIMHLKKMGHAVYGHDVREHAVGRDYLDKFWQSRYVGSEHFIGFLNDVVPQCDVYLPFIDEELRLFVPLEPPTQALLSPPETLAIFTSKQRQQTALYDAGLPVAPRARETPAIVKPDYGRGGKGVMRVERQDVLDMFRQHDDFLCQRAITGMEYTVDVLTNRDGSFVAAVPRKRLAANGFSVIGQIDMRKDAIAVARQVTKAFHFVGPINIQMIDDGSQLWITEVNARLSGSCMFTVMAGVDMLKFSLDIAAGKRINFGEGPAVIDQLILKRRYVEEIHVAAA